MTLPHTHRERLITALQWASGPVMLFVFADTPRLRDRVRVYAVRRGFKNNRLIVLGASPTPDVIHARLNASAQQPTLVLAYSRQRVEIERTNAWERRAFTLDLTG